MYINPTVDIVVDMIMVLEDTIMVVTITADTIIAAITTQHMIMVKVKKRNTITSTHMKDITIDQEDVVDMDTTMVTKKMKEPHWYLR